MFQRRLVARMAQGAEGRPGSSTGGEEDSLDSGPARQERRAAQSCALLDTSKRCTCTCTCTFT